MAAAMGGEAAAPRQETPAQDGERQAAGRNEARRERGERGGRRSERRGDRPEGQNAGVAEVAASQPTGEATPQPAAALDETGNAGDEPRQPRERRSRDRYGRERRERVDNGERSESAANAEPNQAPAQQEQAPVAAEFVAPVAAPAPADAVPASAAAPAAAAVPAMAPAAAAAPAPATSALPKVQAYTLPLQDLAQVAQTSGLQWINSDAAKIAEVQAAIAAEAKPIHVPRERPPLVVATEAPLVLVETKRDLGTLPLPFETPMH